MESWREKSLLRTEFFTGRSTTEGTEAFTKEH